MTSVSLCVPYRDEGDEIRQRSWDWLRRYWSRFLPEAEIVVGTDTDAVFSKSVAVNDAVDLAHGDVLVALDADAYIRPEAIRFAVRAIATRRTWFVPYSTLFRLTLPATAALLATSPEKPMQLYRDGALPPDLWDESATNEFGAMLQVFPRAAWEEVGGWDERFRGWGGEDAAFMRALDTLWAPHESTKDFLYHLWHTRHGGDTATTRMWEGQTDVRQNLVLIHQYRAATGNPSMMRRLLDQRKG